ncbi:exodeoxyribonuclease V subunit beta [Desulfoluna spongiiphila]|uniref:exodeoxyribonuclease V subunit beta n=1 Tax=Desulfoluna spongiiphila TaxID=419481 RepID=UPI001251E209|nr:exodeoxyribonuclease V subunit beta [Desulfoluna spongiiphila]VVS95433.1 exonuclease phage-type/recb c-terminal [Desulfoluna spongiiphila]
MTHTLATLDLAATPLSGRNLIEASAGTGKTYTIAALYLRLVVEEKISVDRILVVTFTEAATQELAERIRGRLREALSFLEGAESDDPFYASLFSEEDASGEAAGRLKAALRNFDEAAIFTIHGFCRRLLTDHAFETGSPLDMELVTDLSYLKQRAVQDYYRRMVEGASPLYAAWVKDRKILPERLLAFLSFSTPLSRITFLPDGEPVPAADCEARFAELLARASLVWEEEQEAALNILATDPALNRNKYRKGVEKKAEAAARALFSGSIPFGEAKDLEKLSQATLQAAVKKGKAVAENPLFGIMESLLEALSDLKEIYDGNLIAHCIALARYVDETMDREKERAGIMGFDDLLSRVAGALGGDGGERLARGVGQSYEAALIDEFQDTDPEQYEIFDTLFKETTLFMIGDPKQAIYGFRGADIFAYLRAAGEAEKGYTLDVNYRSTRGMVQAVNTFFSRGTSPFLFERIQFSPVKSAGGDDEETLTLDGSPVSPMLIQRFEAGEKPLSKEAAQNLCIDLCGAEMVSLLRMGRQGRALLGEVPLSEKHVAVIVRTNGQARAVKNHLTSLGVHAVLYSSGNIFDSEEAEETALFLAACLRPWRLSLIKAALATSMMGLDAETLAALDGSPSELERWSVRFAHWHALWKEEGFMAMLRRFVKEQDPYERLVGLTDGERRVTNMQHLTELLHREAVSRRLSPEGLLRWLSRMRDPESPRLEEHQLHLESDRTAVQIVTIHKSKGLEYGVVFLPFPFMGYREPKGGALYHEGERDLVYDAGSEDLEEHMALAAGESLAEELRLLYVALTRARHHMVIPWGRVKGMERSAMARLLHAPESASAQDAAPVITALGEHELSTHLHDLAAASEGAVSVSLCEPEEEVAVLTFQDDKTELAPSRRFDGKLPEPRVVTSFSGLASSGKETREADYDARAHIKPDDEIPPEGIFAFPKGAAPGTFMHTLFETIPFDSEDEARDVACAELLTRHGYDAELWTEAISTMVASVLTTPLDAFHTPFVLKEVPAGSRLHEMEFTFPLKRISPEALNDALNRWGYGSFDEGELIMEGLRFSPVKGFLKGFVDLIFQVGEGFGIIDWKSNHLGNSPESYGKEALAQAMGEHHYGLQYLLYAVALNRHLALKLGEAYDYETHMAGAWYLFLRGVDGSGNGVFFDRPEEGCIRELDELLIDIG